MTTAPDFGEVADVASPPAPPRFERVDIWAKLPPINWMVQGLDLCPGVVHLVAGFGYSGKTLALQCAGFEIAAGLPVWGCFAARQGRVIHVDYEQGARLTAERYQKLAKGHAQLPDGVQDCLVLVSRPSIYLDTTGAEDVYCRELDGFDLAIVDCLRAAAPSVEENSSDARKVLDLLSRVSERTGCTPIVVHHARKPSADKVGGAKMAIRGSGALFDACGSVLVIEAEKGVAPRVTHEKARTSGRLAADFRLVIQDTDDTGDGQGLRVLAEGIQEQTPDQQAHARLDGLRERITTLLTDRGPQPSRNAVCRQLGANRNDILAALDLMVAEGLVDETGSGRGRRLSLA